MSHPDESGRAIVHPLDTPFGEFQLNSDGRIYAIEVTRLQCQPLYYGLLEWSFMDPEDWADELAETHREELERIERLGVDLSRTWLHWESPVLLTPPPDWRSGEFQNPARWQGNLCAATLTSLDDFFPVPYRNDDGTEVPADYSEASVVYATLRGEGPLPERIRRGIDWEKVAKPKMF